MLPLIKEYLEGHISIFKEKVIGEKYKSDERGVKII